MFKALSASGPTVIFAAPFQNGYKTRCVATCSDGRTTPAPEVRTRCAPASDAPHKRLQHPLRALRNDPECVTQHFTGIENLLSYTTAFDVHGLTFRRVTKHNHGLVF